MKCGIAGCGVYGVCIEKHADPSDLKAEIARLEAEVTRLGRLAHQLIVEGEGGGAYFTNSLKVAALKAAGVEIPAYLQEGVCTY